MKLIILGAIALIYVFTLKLAQFVVALFCILFFGYSAVELIRNTQGLSLKRAA